MELGLITTTLAMSKSRHIIALQFIELANVGLSCRKANIHRVSKKSKQLIVCSVQSKVKSKHGYSSS